MDFSDYLDLDDVDGPKLVGHRIWLFNVLELHLHQGLGATEIVASLPSLNLEKVYACLLYYEQNKQACQKIVDEEIERIERVQREDRAAHPERYGRLTRRLAEQRAANEVRA